MPVFSGLGPFTTFALDTEETIKLAYVSGPVSFGTATTVADMGALTSSQNATAAATDLTTSEALANALKANYNQLQTDVAAMRTALLALTAALRTAGYIA